MTTTACAAAAKASGRAPIASDSRSKSEKVGWMKTVIASAAMSSAGMPNSGRVAADQAAEPWPERLARIGRSGRSSPPWFPWARSCDRLEARREAVGGAQQTGLVRFGDRHFRHHPSAEENDGPVAGERNLG